MHRFARPALRHAAALAGLGFLIALAPSARAETRVKVCELRGGQVVPPTGSAARGCGRFVIDTDANTINYRIAFTALPSGEIAAHIHGAADPGLNAGFLFVLPPGNPKSGVITYSEPMEADLLAGKLYVQIHSTMFPGGEIRGQIADFVADMNAFQVNPSTGTTGQGWGVFNLDRCANTLAYHIEVESLSAPETVAHIHGFALHTANGGVLHPLPAGAIKTGVWSYAEPDEPRILEGQAYVNIHSSAFPGGEIRGQICNVVAPIDGQQQVPPNPSLAYGCGMFAIDTGADGLSFFIAHDGPPSGETAAHIHGFAPPGMNAGVLFPLAVGQNKKGLWSYLPADEVGILDGQTYVNIHSAAFPGGEIRGQIRFAPPPCVADVDCSGGVDVNDLLIVLAAWGLCPAPPAPCPADVNADGTVDVNDLLVVLAGWGACS